MRAVDQLFGGMKEFFAALLPAQHPRDLVRARRFIKRRHLAPRGAAPLFLLDHEMTIGERGDLRLYTPDTGVDPMTVQQTSSASKSKKAVPLPVAPRAECIL